MTSLQDPAGVNADVNQIPREFDRQLGDGSPQESSVALRGRGPVCEVDLQLNGGTSRTLSAGYAESALNTSRHLFNRIEIGCHADLVTTSL